MTIYLIIFRAQSKMGQCLSAAKPIIAQEVRDVILPELVEHVLPRLDDIINTKIEDAIVTATEKLNA